MAITLSVTSDLVPFAPDINRAKAQLMIKDVLARAGQIAPCISEPDFPHADAVQAVLRRVVLRWNAAGTGAAVTETMGPFGRTLDTRQPDQALFWPSEITELQGYCSSWKKQQPTALPQFVMPAPPRDLFGDGFPR